MRFAVTTFNVETIQDMLFLVRFEKFCFVGEVDEEESGNGGNDNSDDTFKDENLISNDIKSLTHLQPLYPEIPSILEMA
jgi:hypothetical protein